jgi:ABC-2 type transport system permease protein/sodium transport system permease protein
MSIDTAPSEPSAPARAAPPAATRVPRHDIGRWLRLARKELRETLRDRRTIITLVLMPILVYPLLSLAFRHFLTEGIAPGSRVQWIVAVDSKATEEAFYQDMQTANRLIIQRRERRAAQAAQEAAIPTRAELAEKDLDDELTLTIHVVADPEASVEHNESDLAVRITQVPVGTAETTEGYQHRYRLSYGKDSHAGRLLAHYVERRLSLLNQFVLRDRLALLERQVFGQSSNITPRRWTFHAVAVPTSQSSLLMLIPLILILMTITGAVYPAIDLTAGERERGTLEALMAAPVPRLGMLFAKYVAVVTVALLTAGVNLAAMFVTAYSLGLSEMLFGERGISAATVGLIVVLLVLFAVFFSAVLLAVTSFARSFKEAQAYLIPLMLLAISPGFFTLMPGMEMNTMLAVTPLVNIVLLARDVLSGTSQAPLAGLAVISTILYALAAIALAARIFGSDAILYGSQGSWSDLFRRPDQPRLAPTLAGAGLCAALVFALQSVLGGILAAWNKDRPSIELAYVGSAVVTLLLYFLFPLAMAKLQFVRVREAFAVRGARPTAFAGVFLLGVSLWPLAHELVLFSGMANPALLERVRERAAELPLVSPALLVVCAALVPAVCEEWFFRGYLLGTVRKGTSASSAIALTALLFALFHVFATVILPVRFLPSLAMGLVLGWVCWRTGSVLPGMLLHASHNGLLILMGHYQEQLKEWGFGIQETQHVPVLWLAVAAAVAAVGAVLVWLSGRESVAATKAAGLQPAPS